MDIETANRIKKNIINYQNKIIEHMDSECESQKDETGEKQCNLPVVMPSAIHINKKYDVVWYNDTVSKNKTGNEIISMINGITPKIKEIKEVPH